MKRLSRARPSTRVALIAAVTVLTGVVAAATQRLVRQDGLDVSIQVDWTLWWLCVAGAYVGLGLVGWWAADRDRQSGSLDGAGTRE